MRAHDPAMVAVSCGIARPYSRIRCVWDLMKEKRSRRSRRVRRRIKRKKKEMVEEETEEP